MLLLKNAVSIREYETADGKSHYGRWFDSLHAPAAAKIVRAVEKMAKGNFSNAKPVGEGVSEYRLDWGPGYRIYFGQDGQTLVILLGGGSKNGQSENIKVAKAAWADYKKRKREAQKALEEKAKKERR